MCCSIAPPPLKEAAVSARQRSFCSRVHVATFSSILVRSPGSSSCGARAPEGVGRHEKRRRSEGIRSSEQAIRRHPRRTLSTSPASHW